MKQILENCVIACTEAVLGTMWDKGVSLSLRASMNVAVLAGGEVVNLMLATKSKASGLSKQNTPNSQLVRQHRKKGALAAKESTAQELVSSFDGSEDSLSNLSSCGGRG